MSTMVDVVGMLVTIGDMTTRLAEQHDQVTVEVALDDDDPLVRLRGLILNADIVAAELRAGGHAEKGIDIAAGRIVVERLRGLVRAGQPSAAIRARSRWADPHGK